MIYHLQRIALSIAFFTITVILSLVVIAVIPYRFFVSSLARVLHSRELTLHKGASTIFHLGSAAKPMFNVVTLIIINGPVTIERFGERIQTRILDREEEGEGGETNRLVYKSLKEVTFKLLGYNFSKEDPQFRIENHVRDWDNGRDGYLPSPCGVSDVQSVLGEFLKRPWREDRSRWEFVLIHGYKNEGSDPDQTAVALRFDHCLSDGFGIIQLLRRLFGAEDLKLVGREMVEPSLGEKIAFPFRMFYDLAGQHLSSYTNSKMLFLPGGAGDAEFYSSVTGHIPVETMKTIKRKLGVSYFVVIMAAVSKTMYKLLSESELDVPGSVSMFLPIPKGSHPGGLVNHFYLVRLALPLKRDFNTKELKELNRGFTEATNSYARYGVRLLLSLLGYLPNCCRTLCKLDYCSISASNVPVIMDSLYFDDFRIVGGWTTVGNIAGILPASLAISSSGLDGKQTICATMDQRVFPNQEKFRNFGPLLERELLNVIQ